MEDQLKIFKFVNKRKIDNNIEESTQQDCFKEKNNRTTGHAITNKVGTITMEPKLFEDGHSCSDHALNEYNMTDYESDSSFKFNDSNSTRSLNEMSSASEQLARIVGHHQVFVMHLPI